MSTTYSDLHVRLDTNIKNKAEAVLDDLGIAPSSAINIFYRQIIAHDGIPFKVVRAKSPTPNIDEMTIEQVNATLDTTRAEITSGKSSTLDEAFREILGDKYAKI